MPLSYVLPHDQADLQDAMTKNPTRHYIVKPSSSSQGKGIFITNNYTEVSGLGQSSIVSEYVDQPLLLDGFKFDMRIYVALTCINPLRIYMYDDGLVRFATKKYSNDVSSRFTHLTNYSLNKKSANF